MTIPGAASDFSDFSPLIISGEDDALIVQIHEDGSIEYGGPGVTAEQAWETFGTGIAEVYRRQREAMRADAERARETPRPTRRRYWRRQPVT